MAERSSSRPQALSKSMRILRRPDYLAVQASGRKIHGAGFVALVVRTPATLPTGRVGFTVTKRIGNAVTRNRIKRRAREWLRRNGWLPAGLDVVFIAKEQAAAQTAPALADDLRRMMGRIASC
jgi:ribonuclease P protein component